MKTIDEFKREMGRNFEMSDLGKLSYYLGIKVCQHDKGITLNQHRYALKILEETGMKDSNPVQIPVDAGLKLAKSEQEREIEATSYRKTVGCFRYLLHTRTDLSYCVGVLSRYTQSPEESHGVALKQCFRYLKGSASYGLAFERSVSHTRKLIGYSDNSYNVDQMMEGVRHVTYSTLAKAL